MVKDENNFLLRLRKDISFFSKPILKNKLESLPKNCSLHIDLTRAEFIDRDIIDTINEFMQHAHLKNISVNKSTYNPLHEPLHPDMSAHSKDDMAH